MSDREAHDLVLSELDIRAEPFALCELEGICSMGLGRQPAATLHYVISGSGALTLQAHPAVPLAPGTLVLVPSSVHHSLINDGSGKTTLPSCEPAGLNLRRHTLHGRDGQSTLIVLCSTVSLSLSGTHGLIDLLRVPLSLDTHRSATARAAIEHLIQEMKTRRAGRGAMIRLLLLQCIIEMLRDRLEADDPAVMWIASMTQPGLWLALRAMLEDPGAAHGLDALARQAGMSRTRFAEQFQHVYGRAPMTFLRELRLARAAQLLAGGHEPVKRIAGKVGFASRSAFTRAFTASWGQSPRQFRRDQA